MNRIDKYRDLLDVIKKFLDDEIGPCVFAETTDGKFFFSVAGAKLNLTVRPSALDSPRLSSPELLGRYLHENRIADTLRGIASVEIVAPNEVSSSMKHLCPFCGAPAAALDIPHLGVFEFDCGTCGTTCWVTPEFLLSLPASRKVRRISFQALSKRSARVARSRAISGVGRMSTTQIMTPRVNR